MFLGLALVLRKRSPLADDLSPGLVEFHIRASSGCNLSTRLTDPARRRPFGGAGHCYDAP